VAVLDALGVRQAVLCGLSMGGYVIFELLRRHPERVRALILADTKPQADSAEAKRGREALIQVAQRDGQDGMIEQLLPRLIAPATQATQPEVAGQVREMARRWSVPGLVGALRVLRDRPDSTETLRGVRVPTLVLVGSEDEIAPPIRRTRWRSSSPTLSITSCLPLDTSRPWSSPWQPAGSWPTS